MHAQAALEIIQAPQEMNLEDTHDIRGAGTFADIGQAIGQVIDTALTVIDTVS